LAAIEISMLNVCHKLIEIITVGESNFEINLTVVTTSKISADPTSPLLQP
jgi:hypothetical protein